MAVHVYVEDCDAMLARMKANGATVLAEAEDLFWGERIARARDPFGHEWGIATVLRDLSPDEIRAAAAKLFDAMAE